MIERGGEVRAEVVPDAEAAHRPATGPRNVEPGISRLHRQPRSPTPASTGTTRIEVVDHADTYVNGQVHTNGMENFWSLLKRGLNGTYVSVEPFHLA